MKPILFAPTLRHATRACLCWIAATAPWNAGSSCLPTTSVRVTLPARGRGPPEAHVVRASAFGQEDTDWAGPRPARRQLVAGRRDQDHSVAHPMSRWQTRALRLTLTLDGFRMDWALPGRDYLRPRPRDCSHSSRAEDACLQTRDGARPR